MRGGAAPAVQARAVHTARVDLPTLQALRDYGDALRKASAIYATCDCCEPLPDSDLGRRLARARMRLCDTRSALDALLLDDDRAP